MYFDGSLKLQGAGAGILFTAPGGEHLKYALQLLFPASNNATEYEALIHGLNIAISLGIKRLMVYGDSLVVISQINKEWDCSNDSMGKYCTAVRKLEDKFEGLEFHHVERDRNTAADVLSKLGSSRTQVPPGVFVQEIPHPSISMDQAEECNIVNQPGSDSDDWRRPITRYIKNEEEPDDKNAAERICRCFETGGSLSRRVNVAACPSPDGSSARPSSKGGSEAAGDRRERGGNPTAFVFVPRPGRVRLQ
jgi:ribonuclease HI